MKVFGQFSTTRFFPDNSRTFPWLLVKFLTFPWHRYNSWTFPGFPDKWSPCSSSTASLLPLPKEEGHVFTSVSLSVSLFDGTCTVEPSLSIMGLTNDPLCSQCSDAVESASHIHIASVIDLWHYEEQYEKIIFTPDRYWLHNSKGQLFHVQVNLVVS